MAEAVFAPERPGEAPGSCLDVSRAKRELGWEPQVHLQDGLRTILDGLELGPIAALVVVTRVGADDRGHRDPKVQSSAIASSQKVQAPTELGRHSEALEKAVESEPSSARLSSRTRRIHPVHSADHPHVGHDRSAAHEFERVEDRGHADPDGPTRGHGPRKRNHVSV